MASRLKSINGIPLFSLVEENIAVDHVTLFYDEQGRVVAWGWGNVLSHEGRVFVDEQKFHLSSDTERKSALYTLIAHGGTHFQSYSRAENGWKPELTGCLSLEGRGDR